MEEKILNAIQHIRSKCKKRVTSQRIYSFINKGALHLESNSFQDFMVGLEIDGYNSKRGKGKSASYFVRKKFIDSSSNEKYENSNSGISMQQNVPSSPQTIEKARKDIENENIELENIQINTPLLNYRDTPQLRNHQRKIENAHLNKSTYCLDKFLQKEISLLRKELDNKQKMIDNLIDLLNGVTTKRDETSFYCKSLQTKNTSEKACHINETISSNKFSIAQNKNQLNVAKEQLTAAPSDTSIKQNIKNFQNCNTVTVSDDVNNNQCKKSNLSHEAQQQEQEKISKARLDHQLKEIRQQYHIVFNVTKQQLVESDKGTKNINLENETHHKWSKYTTLIVGDSTVSGIEENRISRQ